MDGAPQLRPEVPLQIAPRAAGRLFRLAFDGAGATPRTVRPPALSTVGTALRARRAWLDADDRISPFALKRKGAPVLPPDWRRHVHLISDYHWSAAFTRLFLAIEESRTASAKAARRPRTL